MNLLRVLSLLLVAGAAVRAVQRDPAPPEEYSFAIDYAVTVPRPGAKVLRVRWDLSGAEEIEVFRLRANERFSGFRASGALQVQGNTILWLPGGPYGHLEYQVAVDQPRGAKGFFSSYAGPHWIVARSRDLFPRIAITYQPRSSRRPRSRARLRFHLPAGWESAAPHVEVGANEYALRGTGRVLERPRGWLALGELAIARQDIDNVLVRIARVPGSQLDPDKAFALLGDAIPRLRKIFGSGGDQLLIVSAPDPMWHGGLSAYRSFYLHGDRPLRTPDKTSPLLHELFHVLQPFRVTPDADWLGEGLAEYYSLELQQRGGFLTRSGFRKGIEYFSRYGQWQLDLTQQHDNAATNNSAPLVLYVLDHRIQRATSGRKRLDDVLSVLSNPGSPVSTARFERAVEKTAGKRFSRFFERHVRRGQMPRWEVPQ